MKVLKGLALSILGFLLFASLSLLGLVIPLNLTIMNPDFVIGELGKLDTASLVKDQLRTMAGGQVPAEFQSLVGPVIDSAYVKLEPWVKKQANNGIYHFYDYFQGRAASFRFDIPIGEIKGTLHDTIKDSVLKSPQFANLPPALLSQEFEQYYQQVDAFIPQTYSVNESLFPPDVLAKMKQAREYIGYYQTGYKFLIVLIVLLVAGIALLHRSVRGASRALGITALVVGGGALAEFYLTIYLGLPQLAMLNLPAQVKAWLSQVLGDMMSPVQTFAVWLLAIGVILVVVSFFFKPAEEQ